MAESNLLSEVLACVLIVLIVKCCKVPKTWRK